MTVARRISLPNLGLSLLLLAIVVSWFLPVPPDTEVRLGYFLLALSTGGLAVIALIRPPARNRDERWWVFAICLVSITYAFGYRYDQQNTELRVIFWARISLQFLAGVTLLSLGKSYAMLPALREIRRSFFYSYVRHPVYAMYMIADLIVVILEPAIWNMGVAAVGAGAFYMRSRLEESVLGRDPAYVQYMRLVPWRFFPGVL